MTDQTEVKTDKSERLHVLVSPWFKKRLFDEAKSLDMTASDIIKISVNEYFRKHGHAEANNQSGE